MGRLLALLGLAALAWTGYANTAKAQGCATCATGCESGICQRFHCPPPFHHCMERPPCIRIHVGCPRPVCNPCNLPNFGYFQTCWTPWPLPPDWSHCKVPPPAAMVQLTGPVAAPGVPSIAPSKQSAAPGAPVYPNANTNPPPVILTPDANEQLPVPAPFIQPGGKSGR